MEDIIKYLDQLTWEYTQLCLRGNGTVYGIASGKQCRQGKPISEDPNRIRQNQSETGPSQSRSTDTPSGPGLTGSRSIFGDKQPVKGPSLRKDGQIGRGITWEDLEKKPSRGDFILKPRSGEKNQSLPKLTKDQRDKLTVAVTNFLNDKKAKKEKKNNGN